MALSLSYMPKIQNRAPPPNYRPVLQSSYCFSSRVRVHSSVVVVVVTKCELKESKPETVGLSNQKGSKVLEIGSPIIVVEAPKMLKTAASVPCLRVNAGLVNPGDVGRIVSRKPKDVWAVRLSIGTYLIDGKYFKPLELDE